MNLLLIAHEFPPNASPQSLRWMYLTRELVALGHRVDVLTVKLPGAVGAPQVPQGVRVHACFPGPVRATLARLQRRRPAPTPASADNAQRGPIVSASSLNWKGRAVARLVELVERCVFPDIRGEWRLAAEWRLMSILRRLKPDAVVSSHEPATSLELGLLAKRAGYRWVIDLGDPVLAPYTPSRWRDRAYRLERRACTLADAVVVTSANAADLMRERHDVSSHKLHVITQGFDVSADEGKDSTCLAEGGRVMHGCSMENPIAHPDSDVFELFYCGSLYAFRRIDQLLEAIRSVPGARLTVASGQCPDALASAIASSSGQISYLGFLPHDRVLARQRQADLLVSLGNDDPCQVPGKVFEYFGARRPILHLCEHPGRDETAAILSRTGAGLTVENNVSAIVSVLRTLVGSANRSRETPQAIVCCYAWSVLGERYSALLQQVAA